MIEDSETNVNQMDTSDDILMRFGIIKCEGCGIYIVNGEYWTQNRKNYCSDCATLLEINP